MAQKISMKEALTNDPEMVMEIFLEAVYNALVELGEDARYIPWHNNVVSAKMREQGLYSDKDKYSDGEDL